MGYNRYKKGNKLKVNIMEYTEYTQAESNLSTIAGISKYEGTDAGNFRQITQDVTEVITNNDKTVTIEFEDKSSITVYSPERVELS